MIATPAPQRRFCLPDSVREIGNSRPCGTRETGPWSVPNYCFSLPDSGAAPQAIVPTGTRPFRHSRSGSPAAPPLADGTVEAHGDSTAIVDVKSLMRIRRARMTANSRTCRKHAPATVGLFRRSAFRSGTRCSFSGGPTCPRRRRNAAERFDATPSPGALGKQCVPADTRRASRRSPSTSDSTKVQPLLCEAAPNHCGVTALTRR